MDRDALTPEQSEHRLWPRSWCLCGPVADCGKANKPQCLKMVVE